MRQQLLHGRAEGSSVITHQTCHDALLYMREAVMTLNSRHKTGGNKEKKIRKLQIAEVPNSILLYG